MFELLAFVNFGIAAAYVLIGAVIIPQLRLRRFAMLTAAGFFLTCALTHTELGIHALAEHPAWMNSAHMWSIHVAQLAVDWGFIAAMAPWRGRAQSSLARRIEGFLSAGDTTLTPEERQLVSAVGRAATTHDVTAWEVQEAVEAFAEQKRTEQRKDEFIAFASHELRTPATVIYGASETLLRRGDELAPAQRDALIEALAGEGARLKRLIDQLLDLSRYDTGSLAVSLRPVRLRDAIARVVDGDPVAVDVPGDLVAQADEDALERVIGNLVANARRYGAEPITVTGAHLDGRVVVAVEDRGEGVEPAFVPALFRRFTRSNWAAARQTHGAGLGLAIAAAYAKAQGGELRYVAAVPHGARFELELAPAGEGSAATARV